ncbi:MAG: penicillin-binding protein 2 [Chlamydiales bacterium]|nr:penicillin-binding protein 2 [Chlamydiales bacterium]
MKKRLLIVALSLFFLFSLLIVQYFKIQIVEGEKWSEIALSQHECLLKEPFRRGAFFSNSSVKRGHVEEPRALVHDVTKFHLYADPLSIPAEKRGMVVENLSKILGVSSHCIEEELARKSHSRKVQPWLTRDEKEQVTKWWYPYARKEKIASNALFFVTDYQRSYPFGKLLGQVLHTIRDLKDEKTNQGLPTGGLEAYFNLYLQGKEGRRVLLRSPLNRMESDEVVELPEHGADVYLTVNHCIQAIMEEELQKGVAAAQAKGGWAVMMEAKTGEVLGIAQHPFFYPAEYRDYFNDPEKIEQTKVKAITDAFELGSIMKPITMGICLKANEVLVERGETPLFSPAEPVDVNRSLFPGRGSKPLYDLPRHTAINMYMALQKSSNIYMAQLVERVINRLGNAWYREQLVESFGFGQKSGIELPAEAVGLVPRIGKVHANGALEWSLGTPYSLSFGYNILATSLQMLRAISIFPNGGYLVEPTLVKRIVKGDQVLFERSHCPKKRVLSSDSAYEVMKGMKFSTKPGGTGTRAEIPGYTEAGKTGTAEKIVGGVYSKQKYISSFVGFAPARRSEENPLVLVVTLDEPAPIFLEGGVKNYLGGRCAAPVFKEIMRRTLEYLGVPLDDPCGYPEKDPRYDSERADWMCEVRALKQKYDEWNRK